MATDGRYVRFDPKQDDANQVISADHINLLQDTSERVQQGIFEAQDRDFLDKALFILENHSGVNGLWLDTFEDTSKIDLPKTTNLVFSEVEKGIIFPDTSTVTEGYLYSKVFINENQSNMKKVMVVASGYTPTGSNIIVEITNNGLDWYEIPLSESELYEIETDGVKLQLRARFVRTSTANTPRLDAWAIFYYDPRAEIITMDDGTEVIITDPGDDDDLPGVVKIMHNQLMGIGPDDHHPAEHSHDGTDGSGTISHTVLTEVGPDDHHPKAHYHGEDGVPYVRLGTDVVGTLPVENMSYQLWTGKAGQTGMYFDPSMEDKLVYVKSPDDETYLFYDPDNGLRLSHTIQIVQGIAVFERLIYGSYTNSSGEKVTVMSGTDKKMYDATDAEIVRQIQSITAPAAPKGLTVFNPGTGNTLNLSWTPNTEYDMTGYNVYKSSDGGVTWVKLNTTGVIASPSYTATGLTEGSHHLYAVTAVDTKAYESARSTSVEGVPSLVDTVAPAQVTEVAAGKEVDGSIRVVWTAGSEPDIATYALYRSISGTTGTFTRVQTIGVGTDTIVDSNLTVGTTYFYYVTAIDATGNESVPSQIVSATA